MTRDGLSGRRLTSRHVTHFRSRNIRFDIDELCWSTDTPAPEVGQEVSDRGERHAVPAVPETEPIFRAHF